MPVALFRIDDRLIHGQVVVGWGQTLGAAFIVLVDDAVAASDWEQELYRMGVPPEMNVAFETISSALAKLAAYQARPEAGILLTADIESMRRLVEGSLGSIRAVNLGGVHHQTGRAARLRYVFLSPGEETSLRAIAAAGAAVSAQDMPAATPLPLEQVLVGTGE